MEPLDRACDSMAQPEGGEPPRILLVEQEPVLRGVHALLFALHGWSCRTVPSGNQALLEQREFEPDVAVLDVNMPDISGFALAARLRIAQPTIALIAYSGDVEKWTADELRAVGFDVALPKSCGFEKLEATVRQLIGRDSLHVAAVAPPSPKPRRIVRRT